MALADSLRRFFELSADIFLVGGFDGFVLNINPAATKLLGFTREELQAQPVLSFVHVEDRPSSAQKLGGLASGSSVANFECRIRCKDGSYRWLLWNAAPSPDTNEFYAIGRDITERKHFEAALAETRDRALDAQELLRQYRDIVEAAGDAITIARRSDGRVLEVNERTCTALGYTREELLGRDYREFRAFTVDPTKEAVELMGAEGAKYETVTRHKDGHLIPIEVVARPIVLRGEQALVAISRDITERKHFEQALAEARDRAIQAERFKSNFLAMISHELRTPLNVVVGAANLLAADPPPDEAREYIAILKQAAEALLTTVNYVLDFTKLEAGSISLEPQDFSVVELVDRVAALFEWQAAAKQLALTTSYASNVPEFVHGDPARLRNVLVNLLHNAIKFTEKGSIAVDVSVQSRSPNALALFFAVTDTGLGVSDVAREELFRPFAPGRPAGPDGHAGAGLGLAISKNLVEAMGGEIGVESRDGGKGATFWFTVPLQPASAQPPTARIPTPLSAPAPSSAAAMPRVLVVEDDRLTQTIMRKQLERLGVQVEICEDGTRVIEAMNRGGYEMIFMDRHLPGIDGLEATRMLRKAEAGKVMRTPVIAVTAAALGGDREVCIAAGMDDFLSKPVTPEALRDVLDRWLPVRTGLG